MNGEKPKSRASSSKEKKIMPSHVRKLPNFSKKGRVKNRGEDPFQICQVL